MKQFNITDNKLDLSYRRDSNISELEGTAFKCYVKNPEKFVIKNRLVTL